MDLRKASARFISALPFDGCGIGGEFGDNKRSMSKMIGWVVNELPPEKLRHLLGIGHLADIPEIIKTGIDTFDCIAPTHYARRGIAFTSRGALNLGQKSFTRDMKPLDSTCKCHVCFHYTRAYVCHLLRAGEISAMSMLTLHNLFFFNSVVAKYRAMILAGKI